MVEPSGKTKRIKENKKASEGCFVEKITYDNVSELFFLQTTRGRDPTQVANFGVFNPACRRQCSRSICVLWLIMGWLVGV